MKNLLYLLASAIASAEGYFVADSLPQRNNNPGDLRAAPWLPTATVEHGFWHAMDQAQGLAGLYHQIALDVARGYTLRKLVYTWAPPNENDSENYLRETARRTGLPYVPITQADQEKPLWVYLEIDKID